MTSLKIDKILKTLKMALQLDDLETVKCVLESLVEELEDEKGAKKK